MSLQKVVAVIDGNSLMHRAFHAISAPLTAPDGTPTNAVYGFMVMLIRFIQEQKPDAVVCAFDSGKPQFRIDKLPQYKANRPPMDENLRPQFAVAEEILKALNVPVVKISGIEGDDILGSVAHQASKLNMASHLLTGDKDAYQLINDTVSVFTTVRGTSSLGIYDKQAVFDRYGVWPRQFIDYLGLMGDSADNIPGVSGIGPKKASTLLQKFDSLEGIYEHIDELRGKDKEHLCEDKDKAFLSRDIATIRNDVALDLDLETLVFPQCDFAYVQTVLNKYNLKALVTRIRELLHEDESAADVTDGSMHDRFEARVALQSDEALAFVENALHAHTRLALSYRSVDTPHLFQSAHVLACASDAGLALVSSDDAPQLLARIIKQGSFAAYDVKSLIQQVFPTDSALPSPLSNHDVITMDAFDVRLASYLLRSSEQNQTLAFLAESYLHQVLPDHDESDNTACVCLEADVVSQLVPELCQLLQNDSSWNVFTTIDAPLVGVLACMERTGAAIDSQHMSDILQETTEKLQRYEQKITELAGESFNIDSPMQLAHILFDVLGLPPGKKTQRGYSTNSAELERLSVLHPLPKAILEYRELAKLRSTYLTTLLDLADHSADGFIHTTFNQTITTTGRLSSSDPNLQNIPVRSELGRSIRSCFVPRAHDEVFLSADYSQIELRLLAHLSGDTKLIEAFNSGVDFHTLTAAHVFGIPVEQVSASQRSHAKAVNFGIVYGQQAYGLATSLGISRAEAKDMIDSYFAVYPQVRHYLDETVQFARTHGFAQTMFGRKRHIPQLRSTNKNISAFGARMAMNHPMQGSAADLIKLAMINVARIIDEERFDAHLLLQVHDELDFSVKQNQVDDFRERVLDCMEHVVELSVPLRVDARIAPNWAQAH